MRLWTAMLGAWLAAGPTPGDGSAKASRALGEAGREPVHVVAPDRITSGMAEEQPAAPAPRASAQPTTGEPRPKAS